MYGVFKFIQRKQVLPLWEKHRDFFLTISKFSRIALVQGLPVNLNGLPMDFPAVFFATDEELPTNICLSFSNIAVGVIQSQFKISRLHDRMIGNIVVEKNLHLGVKVAGCATVFTL